MKRNKFILTSRVARLQSEICESLYGKSIQSVYDYAAKVKMPETYCEPCEAETPTIIDFNFDSCALCGQSKTIQKEYTL